MRFKDEVQGSRKGLRTFSSTTKNTGMQPSTMESMMLFLEIESPGGSAQKVDSSLASARFLWIRACSSVWVQE